MKTARCVAISASLNPDTYIYKILPISTDLVSISSDDSLRVLDPPTLEVYGSVHGIHDGVTCLSGFRDRLGLTAGRDGLVNTDGLVNLFDTSVTDEDDALIQIFNHGSSISHSGFLSDHEIYALSHDEIFSIYGTTGYDQAEAPIPTCALGDLRPHLQCEYVVDLISSESTGPVLGAANTLHLPHAHGEEIVRSLCFSRDGNTIFTAGEDGLIKVWRSSEESADTTKAYDSGVTDKKPKKHNHSDKDKRARFNPY
ncbi:MAG: hypothetical protein Q9192_003036 [Flavoplaca navasiana]